ncbi:MAG: hypothetical protein GX562_00500 [Coriobacteriaceae bacterium]|nr:hypothetical protein [Coriobacteriaceae bacterium]
MKQTVHSMFIGMCLWKPSILFKTKVMPTDFTDEKESTLFSAMQAIVKEGGLPDEGSLHTRTGIAISDLLPYKAVDLVPTTANWGFYDRQIREATAGRLLRRKAEEILSSKGMSSGDIIASLQEVINDVQNHSVDFEICDIQGTVSSTVDVIMERARVGQQCIGIPSGLSKLDEMILGFQPRRLYYIGARPSQGKTALLLNFVANCPEHCGVISAESGKEELTIRMLARKGLIDSQRLVLGKLKDNDMDRLKMAAANLNDHAGIYIYDEPNPSVDTVVNIARQMKRRWDIKALFIDYLQCLSPAVGMSNKPYHQQVAHASTVMKHLARTLNIPIVVAAQLKRDAEGTRPQLSDFSDSTQIERDADVVVMIYNKYDPETHVLTDTWLLVEKNRDGRRGNVRVAFKQEHVSFSDTTP